MDARLRSGNAADDIERNVTRRAGILVQIELALAKRVIRVITIIADSTQHQTIDTVLGCNMRDCRTFISTQSACVASMAASAHGITRHKAVARSDGAVQELFGVFLRNFRIQQCVHKPMLDKHGGCNINQSRCRGKFLKLRRDSAMSAVSVSR